MHDLSIYVIMVTALHARKFSTLKDAGSLCELIAGHVHECNCSPHSLPALLVPTENYKLTSRA